MKKLLGLLIFFFPLIGLAQNVAINNDGSLPDPTALLDIKSNSKGILIPRLTTAERNGIVSPTIGLTVFDTETVSYWMFRGDVNGGWAELQHTYQSFWDGSGGDVFNKNPGNVGIGTNMPASKLTINGIDPVIGIMNNGLANSFIQAEGFNMRISTSFDNATGKMMLGAKGNDHLVIDAFGRVGIGTSSNFDAEFKLNGTSPRFAFLHNEVQKGFIRLTGDDFKMGTYPNNSGRLVFSPKGIDKIWIDEDGQMGIGTSSPSSILTINGTEPIIQLRNGDVDKGFIQLVGDYLRVGTNLSNTFGSFIVRTKGQDRVIINHEGQMGLNVVPDELNTTLAVGEDENGNTGVELVQNDTRRGMFSFNGTNTFLTSSTGSLYVYRNSNYPMILHSNGDFSMGGPSKAFGYRLSVYGKVIATEYTTLPIGDWPDYVFEKNYNLKPLKEVKEFIERNKHLPNIPAATQIEKEGIQLGQMTKSLLEKVEELTLYVLQQQEQIDELKKQIQAKSGK